MITKILKETQALVDKGEPFALATVVRAERPTSAKPGAKALITADGTLTGWIGGSCAEPTVRQEALKALIDGHPRLLRLCPPEALGIKSQEGVVEVALTCISGGTYEIYIEPQLVQPNLVVIGHLGTSEALVKLGKVLGYPVTVMGLEVNQERFPLADFVQDHIDFSQVKITSQTFIIVASHGNYDEDALVAALRTQAPFVTLVASPRRSEAILQYLHDSDLPEGWEARFKYPAGLDFGAETAEEIALSILGEIIQIRRQKQKETSLLVQESQKEKEDSFATDPICGMKVEKETARYTSEYSGKNYYFCAAGCKHSFDKDPENYIVKE